MKKIILSAGLLLCSLSPCITNAQQLSPTWSHVADATHGDRVRDLWVSTQGDSYMFGGITFLDDMFDHQGTMLIKVNTQGTEVWRKYIHGATADWKAEARGVTGDAAGNVYVVYDEYRDLPFNNQRVVARKYNANGDLVWSHYYTPQVDNTVEQLYTGSLLIKDGYLYATGTSFIRTSMFGDVENDGFVYKINSDTGAGVKFIHNSTQYGGEDYLMEAVVDNSGNVYAIGRSKSSADPESSFYEYDSVVVKFNASGNKVWEHWLNGADDMEDFGISLSLDSQGNVYASSQLEVANTSQNMVMVQKLSPQGAVLWSYSFMGPSTEYLWRQPVEALPNGNVALVTSDSDGITTKVLNGTTGTLVWSDNYNLNNIGFGNHHSDMIVDGQGNIFVTGTSKGTWDPGASKDILTIKYNSAGQRLWLSAFNYTNYFNFGDDGVTLALDGAGNVYTTGWVYEPGANVQFMLIKYGNATVLGNPSENHLAGSKVYPNPVNDLAFFSLPDGVSVEKAQLIDLNGRIVKEWTDVMPSEGLAMQDIKPGMYLLTAHTGESVASFKIIKN